MFVYLSKKISIPNNVQLRCISWSKLEGYIACGGDGGLLKVLKLETSIKDGSKSLAAPSNLSVNQNLEGHNGAVRVIVWNEGHQKLTTSDQFGYIIVWMMYKGSWYEEMINNRNKSVVTDMAWNNDGTKICIVYEDGIVIVGSVDGNRIWGKEIKASLIAVEWSPGGRLVLFGLASGEIHAYDNQGNFVSKLPIVCIQTVGEGTLVGIEWFSQDPEHDHNGALAVIYQHGAMQIMRNENDHEPIVLQHEKFRIFSAQWNHTGTMLALAGQKHDLPDGEQNVVYFINPAGEHLRMLKVPGKEIAGCSWENSGLRIALAVDSHIFFANIRPDYKVFLWAYCAQTVVYSFRRNDRTEACVGFWDTKLDEIYFKFVKDLINIACHGEYCVLVNKSDDVNGQYLFQLCNGIGTPVDFKYVDIEPIYIAMTENHVIAASKETFYLWHYSVPRRANREMQLALPKKTKVGEKLYHIDQPIIDNPDNAVTDMKKAFAKTMDPICAICANEKVLLIARDSSVVHKYSLPNLTLIQKYTFTSRPQKMSVNCNGTRVSFINIAGLLHLYDLEGKGNEIANFERKDVWDMKWDEDNDQLLAIMEKTRLYVLKGTEPEEPIISSGYICSFRDMTVRTALIDDLVINPDQPQKDWLIDVEIKALRDAKVLLEKMNLQEAAQYIDKNPHPKLWSLLAEVSLINLDTSMAEHAFVRLKDYAGIQFVKKVNNIQNETLRKAEIAAYFGRFDEAEKIYLDNDRRDLALALRRKLGDWFRVLQLLQVGSGAGDDVQMEEAWNAVGDYYADRQKWSNAIQHYLPGRNHEKLADCYYMMEDYDNLEKLMHSLPDNHKMLPQIGEMFANAGLCEQAVDAYTRCNQVKHALDICIQLNQWDAAIQLAKSYDVPDVDNLLAKYAEQLIGDSEKSLTAVQLYRKAGRFLDAAKLIYQLAEDERAKRSSPARMKKIYVLAAMLIEQYHDQNKAKVTEKAGKRNVEAKAALSGLLEEDSINFMDSKLIDNAWRGAEAFHFYMLAQSQLYDGNVDAAMKTALHLTDYDDIIDPLEIYSILALSSCASRQFSVCSRAFIKLESLETLLDDERAAYEKLALTIFTKHSSKDSRSNKAECTGCETLIPDYCQVCPSCDTKFPTCIVSGRPLMDYQFWLCPMCKHRAYEQEILTHKYCPLCHTAI